MSAVPAIPTVTDELNRKTIEAMLWLAEKRDSGEITDSDFYLGAEIAFMITSGLVDKDIAALTWTNEPESYKHRHETVVLRKLDSILILERPVKSAPTPTLTLIRDGKISRHKYCNGYSFKRAMQSWIDKGWSPLTEEMNNA